MSSLMQNCDKLEKMAVETEKLLRSVLESSKNSVPLTQLERDYSCITGDKIPFSSLGYSSLESYLKSIPNVVRIISIKGQIQVEAIPDESTRHIADLIVRQRGKRGKANKKMFSTAPSYPRNSYLNNKINASNVELRRSKPPHHEKPPRFLRESKPQTSRPKLSSPPLEEISYPRSLPPVKPTEVPLPKPTQQIQLAKSIEPPKQESIKKPVLSTPPASIYDNKWKTTKITQNGNGPNPRNVSYVKETPTSYKQMLERFARSHNLETPIFSLIPMPELHGYMATVKINNQSFSSYPTENLTQDDAQEVAAEKAIEVLGYRTDNDQPIVSTEVEVVFSRIKQLLQDYQRGVISNEIPVRYKEEFKENLPDGWLKIIMDRRIINYKKINEEKIILYPEDDSERLSSNASTTDSDDVASTDLNANTECWEIFLCHVVSSKCFFVRFVETSEEFEALSNRMEKEYANIKYKLTISDIVVDKYYAAHFANCWHRIKAKSVQSNKVLCKFVDNGDYDFVTINSIQPLKPEFLSLSEQAIECQLYGLEEYADNATCLLALQNQCGNVYVAEVKHKDKRASLVLYDTSQDDENVNEKILSKILEVDITPSLPNVGVVCDKPVYLSHVSSNGNIYVQIQNECYYFVEELLKEIRESCENIPSVSRSDIIVGAAIYIANYDDEWYRARIDEIKGDKLSVFFIDFGNSEILSFENVKKLLPLQEILPKLPALAFNCKLLGVPPTDELEWTEAAIKKLNEIALDQSVLLKVVIPGTSHTLPAVEIFKRIQPDNQLVAIKETLTLSQGLFRPKMPRSDDNTSSAIMNILRPPDIPEIGFYLSVQVALTASPWNFRCQPWDSLVTFEKLTEDMQDYYDNQDNFNSVDSNTIQIGGFYACKHLTDQLWYRVQVKGYDTNISVLSLYYIDFGDTVVASASDIHPLLNKFKELPYQAIFCKLYGVSPKNKDWRPEDCIRFRDLVETRVFVAEICSKCNEDDLLTLGVRLIDTSCEDVDTDIGQLLIAEGRAIET